MLTVKEQWNDSAYAARAYITEKTYGDDFQREPPLVSNKMPAARIFNWRLPPVSLSQPWSIMLQSMFFVKFAIGASAAAVACKIWGHDPNPDRNCNRCGYYNKEE